MLAAVTGHAHDLPDLNLLVVLDVLLAEQSVARAAKKLRLSASAMSRALARLRRVTGDPLLVQAGRGLVPSPRAVALRELVARLVREAHEVLQPGEHLVLAKLQRTFTLRTSEGFVENFGAALVTRVAEQAPGVRLSFVPKLDKDSTPLRDASVDLETGVVGKSTGPEVRAQALFRDRFVGVVRSGHPLSKGKITIERYAAARHIRVARPGSDKGPIDSALASSGIQRRVATIVGGYSAALALTRACDLVATVPERHTGDLRTGLFSFALPLTLPPITVSMLWHPRMDGDPAHRWLRGCVREACAPTAGE